MSSRKFEIITAGIFVVFIVFTGGFFTGRQSVSGTMVITPYDDVSEKVSSGEMRTVDKNESSSETSAESAVSERDSEPDSEPDMSSSSTDEGLDSSIKEPVASPEPENSIIWPVNINIASEAELDALPGVGPVIAQRIIEYRSANGGFASIDEIKNVSGIGEAKFNKMRDLIIV